MSAVYRCKVRKPDGSIVDGCGHEGTYECSCDGCGVGFMRIREIDHAIGRTHRGGQIHGGPLVVEAHRPTQAEDERQSALRSATYRLASLQIFNGEGHTQAAADHVLRETIALLQSLLPANQAADKQAQVDMAAEHNASADAREIASSLRAAACQILADAGYLSPTTLHAQSLREALSWLGRPT